VNVVLLRIGIERKLRPPRNSGEITYESKGTSMKLGGKRLTQMKKGPQDQREERERTSTVAEEGVFDQDKKHGGLLSKPRGRT